MMIIMRLSLFYKGYQSVLLCGIEAHACILSTCFDLIEAGKDVHVIVDAVSSRSLVDRFFFLFFKKFNF